MARALTTDERAVLAHVVLDPDEWWAHVNEVDKINAEEALAAKVTRWRPAFEAAVAAEGEDYQNCAERLAGA